MHPVRTRPSRRAKDLAKAGIRDSLDQEVFKDFAHPKHDDSADDVNESNSSGGGDGTDVYDDDERPPGAAARKSPKEDLASFLQREKQRASSPVGLGTWGNIESNIPGTTSTVDVVNGSPRKKKRISHVADSLALVEDPAGRGDTHCVDDVADSADSLAFVEDSAGRGDTPMVENSEQIRTNETLETNDSNATDDQGTAPASPTPLNSPALPSSSNSPTTERSTVLPVADVYDTQERPVFVQLLSQAHEDLVTRPTFLLYELMQPWVIETIDLHGSLRKFSEGHRGLRCGYCGSCKQFSAIEILQKNHAHIVRHFTDSCPGCPSDIKDQLKAGKGTKDGNRLGFLRLLLSRLHGVDESAITASQKAARERFAKLAPPRKGPSKAKKRSAVPTVAPPKKIPDVFLRLHDIPQNVANEYVEETAFLHHNQPFSADKLATEEATDEPLPLPPAPPLPSCEDFPEGSVAWSVFPDTQIVLANFSKVKGAASIDEVQCVRSMMERDDVTVILEGLYNGIYSREKLASSSRWHHKFRRFKLDTTSGRYNEESGYLALKTADFFSVYLTRREEVLAGKTDLDPVVVLSQANGMEVAIDVRTDVIYMTDLNLPTGLPELNDKFRSNFKLPQLLPGGEWCSQFQVPVSARNEMGPNLYISPPGGFTHFHQDGFGTVDSGHLNLAGYNEVVMTRRLPERHKRQVALDIQRGTEVFNAAYSQPHSDSKKPPWPSDEIIAQWKERGYCPSVFILKPGQFIHINKGRMHAFRKLCLEELPPNDCHAALRKNLIREEKLPVAPVCVSIAWDWQFFGGASAEGTSREAMTMLEAQLILDSKNRNDPSGIWQSLATPRTALLASALSLSVTVGNRDDIVARGIREPLLYLLQSELATFAEASRISSEPHTAVDSVQPRSVWLPQSSDQSQNPEVSQIDPDGVDYSCQLCYTELANCYFHCFGCEKLLGRDFNFCGDCFKTQKWAATKKMGPRGLDFSENSLLDHVGDRPERCRSCKCSKKCKFCKRCYEHACICHTCSTLHCRYYDKKDLERLKEGAAAVDKLSVDSEEIANARLAAAQDREGNGALEKQQILQFWKESGRSGLIWPEPPVAEPVANLLRSSRVVGRSRKRRTHDAFKR